MTAEYIFIRIPALRTSKRHKNSTRTRTLDRTLTLPYLATLLCSYSQSARKAVLKDSFSASITATYRTFSINFNLKENSMSTDDPSNVAVTGVPTIISGLTAAANLPWQRYSLASKKFLSSSTVAGIVDKSTKQWLVRVDKAHLTGTKFPHINVNHRLTLKPDPHLKIPSAAVPILGTSHSVINTVTDWLPTIYCLINTGRLGSAMYQDISEESFPEKTVDTGRLIAAETTGGLVGGTMGSKVGVVVGGLVGNIPGAAAGSMIGGAVGGVAGAYGGACLAHHVNQENVTAGVKMAGNAAVYAASTAMYATKVGAGVAVRAGSSAVEYAKNVDTTPITNACHRFVISPIKSKL